MDRLQLAVFSLAVPIAFACPDESSADYPRPSFGAALFAAVFWGLL